MKALDEDREPAGELIPLLPRPRTRGDCANVPRPCPFVSCRFHLYLDVSVRGRLTLNFPDKEPHELENSCALDVAEQGGVSHLEVANISGVTKQAILQNEGRALRKLALPVLMKVFKETKGER